MLQDSDEDILLTVQLTRDPRIDSNYTLPRELLTHEVHRTEREALPLVQNQITNLLPQNTNDNFEKLRRTLITQHDISTYEKCSICHEDFELNQIAKLLPCQHIYHQHCLQKRVQIYNNKICPLCRITII